MTSARLGENKNENLYLKLFILFNFAHSFSTFISSQRKKCYWRKYTKIREREQPYFAIVNLICIHNRNIPAFASYTSLFGRQCFFGNFSLHKFIV